MSYMSSASIRTESEARDGRGDGSRSESIAEEIASPAQRDSLSGITEEISSPVHDKSLSIAEEIASDKGESPTGLVCNAHYIHPINAFSSQKQPSNFLLQIFS